MINLERTRIYRQVYKNQDGYDFLQIQSKKKRLEEQNQPTDWSKFIQVLSYYHYYYRKL